MSDDYSLGLFSNIHPASYNSIFKKNELNTISKEDRYAFILDETTYAPLSNQEFLSYRFLSQSDHSWPNYFSKLSKQNLLHPVRLGETSEDIKLQLLRLSRNKYPLQDIQYIIHAFGIMDACSNADDLTKLTADLKQSLDSIEKFFNPLNQKIKVFVLGMPVPGIEDKFLDHCFDGKERKSLRDILKEELNSSQASPLLWETLNFSDQSASERCPALSSFPPSEMKKDKKLSQLANAISDYRNLAKSLVEEKNKIQSSLLTWQFIDTSKKIFWKRSDTVYNCFDLSSESSAKFAEFIFREIQAASDLTKPQ